VILLAVIVIGRNESSFTFQLLIPPLAVLTAWSVWAISSASTELWAAALTWPLTQRPDWYLAAGVIGLGLPFSPFCFLALSRPLRESWGPPARQLFLGWLQIAVACLVAGTIIPGLALAARVPALAGIAMVAAAGLDVAWTRSLTSWARKFFFAIIFGLLALWLITLLYGGYVWTLVLPYYRPLGIAVLLLGLPIMVLGWSAGQRANSRRALVALVVLTVSLKLVHWGYYVPEWNYRHGQGPWGRAIGQWLLPNWTVHIFNDWSPDLMFTVGRPVRKLMSPQHLAFPVSPESKHVLLLESEFKHWPDDAPSLLKVAEFQDRRGRKHVLARTEGTLVTPSGVLLPNEDSP
jgi:hypothetical protein